MKKISNRLQKINSMVSSNYHSIWDCCCDHGLLGLTLLKRKAATTIHFVDIVPSLINHLESILNKHFSSDDYAQRWQVHCTDVAQLPLATRGKHLIIIAGVGGELVIEFVDSIISKIQQNLVKNSITRPAIEIEFILCPVHYNFQVRQSLLKHNFTLLDECIVKENKRFYEIIHVKKTFSNSAAFSNKLTTTGASMWDLSNEDHQQYLAKMLSHYQRMLIAANSDEQKSINHIIEQYSELLPQASTKS